MIRTYILELNLAVQCKHVYRVFDEEYIMKLQYNVLLTLSIMVKTTNSAFLGHSAALVSDYPTTDHDRCLAQANLISYFVSHPCLQYFSPYCLKFYHCYLSHV